MPRPRYGALLSEGLRTMSRSGGPARPRPVLSAAPPRLFNVDEHFGRATEAHAGVESHDARCGFLIVRAEAVLSTVRCVEIRMSLKNEVGLTGEPEARVLEM